MSKEITGFLEVMTNGKGEVSIKDTGIILSVKEAQDLGYTLQRKAADAYEEIKSLQRKEAESIPVDRSCQVLAGGQPVPEDRSHAELKPNGQQKDYVVLCDAERKKGFVRPYRDSYRHLKCGDITRMSRSIAETYARDPLFYSGTFCATCGSHFPVGEDGEFVWVEWNGKNGSKVGS